MARSLGRLGLLVPATLACAFATDVALRLLPQDWVTFRAWEAVLAPESDAPFLPNQHYHNARTYGNLAAIANLPASREYHPVTFTTDALGYANPPELARRGDARAIVFGSSFAAGSEEGDGLTLAAQLATASGRPVYNAASGARGAAEILSLARRVVIPGGLVIFEYPEGRELPPITPLPLPHPTSRCRAVLAPRGLDHACTALAWLQRRVRISPLAIVCQRAVKWLEDGRWFPNPYAQNVLRERLANGQEMLFLPSERDEFHTGAPREPAVQVFRWLRAKLWAEHFTLLVVLVPTKYAVYAPLLRTPDAGPDQSTRYLADVARRLGAAGIPTVNLLPSYRAAARRALAEDRYIYLRDDTHWNAAGVGVAARELWRAWQALQGAGAPSTP
ncbi:MAG TPA: hypothetical protein VH116_13110 [Gemmatimonadales bacterium]|nr:hypothetical protein [Gemmatimonadales bacterium]